MQSKRTTTYGYWLSRSGILIARLSGAQIERNRG
ncbi:hypothetical protein LDDCCGHA_5315 [Methylobacterium oxalidis]|nr:hypothetical protein LDDCCGHA_5315 [Methylobacterium oxalidis]